MAGFPSGPHGQTQSSDGQRPQSSAQRSESAFWLVLPVDEDALSGPIKILILTTPQRPQKAGQPQCAKEQSYWYEVDERRHDGCTDARMPERLAEGALVTLASTKPCRRNAFPMTKSDEADIAIAAISGVTWPRMAIGTATAL